MAGKGTRDGSGSSFLVRHFRHFTAGAVAVDAARDCARRLEPGGGMLVTPRVVEQDAWRWPAFAPGAVLAET